jgi:hypothetical protein
MTHALLITPARAGKLDLPKTIRLQFPAISVDEFKPLPQPPAPTYLQITGVFDEASYPEVNTGESSDKSVSSIPLADDDPLAFLDEDESSENEPVQMPSEKSPVDNVGRFMTLWKKSAVSLAQLLKDKGITTCQVFVVFTDAKNHRFEKLATIAITKRGFNYQTKMSDKVSKNLSNHFINSTSEST